MIDLVWKMRPLIASPGSLLFAATGKLIAQIVSEEAKLSVQCVTLFKCGAKTKEPLKYLLFTKPSQKILQTRLLYVIYIQ